MHIDWFTVAAQAINFLVLMWLLRRFLYKPILNAITAREKYIADQLASAKTVEAEAQKSQADFTLKNETFDKQKSVLLRDARKAADTERDRLLNLAKQEADALRSKRKEALAQEIKNLQENTASQMRDEVFATTKKLLHDLADERLEERMIAVFITRLKELCATDLATIGVNSLTSQPVRISSAFALSPENQTTITKAVKETLNTESLIFKIVPELLSGIELSVEGHKLAWSIPDYMASMEDAVSAASKSEASEHAA